MRSDEECIQPLKELFVSYYSAEANGNTHLKLDEHFSVSPMGNAFEVSDWAAPKGLPSDYLVRRQQVGDERWGVQEILQAEWDEWITIPPHPDWGMGFPLCDSGDWREGALYWLRAKTRAHLEDKFPNLPG